MVKRRSGGVLGLGVLAAVACGGAAWAAETAVTLPCKAAVDKYCKKVVPGAGRLLACLKEHRADLSPECRARIDAGDTGIGAGAGRRAFTACAADIGKLCKGVRTGGGRIYTCLTTHQSELSSGCKAALEPTKTSR